MGSEESVACEITCLESVNCLSLCLNFQSKSDQLESSLATLLRLLPFTHLTKSGFAQNLALRQKGSVSLSLSIAQLRRMSQPATTITADLSGAWSRGQLNFLVSASQTHTRLSNLTPVWTQQTTQFDNECCYVNYVSPQPLRLPRSLLASDVASDLVQLVWFTSAHLQTVWRRELDQLEKKNKHNNNFHICRSMWTNGWAEMCCQVWKRPMLPKDTGNPWMKIQRGQLKYWQGGREGYTGEKVNKAEVKHTRMITGGGKKIHRQDALNEGVEVERKRRFE